MPRSDAADHQPPLGWWSHTWRVVAMAALSGLGWATAFGQQSTPARMLDVVLGLAALGLVHARRRHPLAVAVVVTALTALSGLATGRRRSPSCRWRPTAGGGHWSPWAP